MTTPATPTQQNDRRKRFGKKALSIAFNIAAGAAVTAAAKTAVVATMTWATAPALATLLISSFAVGAAATTFSHAMQTRAAKKSGAAGPKFWSRRNAKTFATSSGLALIGGALFLGFNEGIFGKIFGSAPAEAAAPAPVAEAIPVAAPCPTPMQSFAALIDGHTVSDRVTDALARAESTNARVAAQGVKDLAFFANNGFDGVPKDGGVALDLFRQAAEAGNTQAKIDLLYMQYHGLNGIDANPDAARAAMNDINTARAAMFVENWGGADKVTEAVSFDAKTILQNVKPACAAL